MVVLVVVGQRLAFKRAQGLTSACGSQLCLVMKKSDRWDSFGHVSISGNLAFEEPMVWKRAYANPRQLGFG